MNFELDATISIKFDKSKGSNLYMLITENADGDEFVTELRVANDKPKSAEGFWKKVSEGDLGGAANKTVFIDKRFASVRKIDG